MKDTKMVNSEDRSAFITKFHNREFGAEIFAATKVQAGLARVFTRAEVKAFNRVVNRGSVEDVEDLCVAYRLIGGKIAAESRKKLTFLLCGEKKSEVKNGKMVHYLEHKTDKELRAAAPKKKDLMTRIKLLSENFAYVAKNTDKIETLLKAYARLSSEDRLVFLRKLSELMK